MWRAQPLLSGATCPAGSKTSCCESFFIHLQHSSESPPPRESRLHPLSIPSSHFSLKLTNALVFFLSSLLSYFLSTLTPSPFSSLPHQALLIPVFHTAHPHCIHTSTTSSSSCAVPRHPCLAFSQHLLPLFCLFILRFLLDLHFLSMTSTPTYTPPPPPPPRIWTSGYTIYCHRLVILLFSRTN